VFVALDGPRKVGHDKLGKAMIIEPNLLLAFSASVTLLMLIPGPNVALIVANSVAYGSRHGLMTVAGTAAAQALSLALVALGLTALLENFSLWFSWLRWIGAAYLIFLGIQLWRAPAPDLNAAPQGRAHGPLFLQAFLISLANPKTLIFYGAFLPQFISLDRPVAPQMALLSILFLVIAVVMDSGWALIAARARGFIAAKGKLASRISGTLLIGAGVTLGLLRAR
jgi:threonine/homoserine/homoserine lactone efflux protein